jgi:GT2 family glycosyltransferase
MLAALRHPDLDVIVVNIEDDPTIAKLASGVRVEALPENLGYAAAVNLGARSAQTEVVVFLNDDAVISATDVLHLADVVASGAADVAVPRVVDRNGELERTITALATPWTLAREWLLLPDRPLRGLDKLLDIEKWRSPLRSERVAAVSAIAVATRRQLLIDEPLPEVYFLYWEEMEWFWRLHRRSARVLLVPDLTVVHEGGREDVRAEKSRLLARNAVRCVRRTQGRRAALCAYGIVILWNARLVAVDLARSRFHRGGTSRSRAEARFAGLRAALASWRELA